MSILENYINIDVSDDFKREHFKTLSNWSYLSFYMSSKDPSAEDIGKLIRYELQGKKREQIIQRLVQRLGTAIRKQLKVEMEELVNARTNY